MFNFRASTGDAIVRLRFREHQSISWINSFGSCSSLDIDRINGADNFDLPGGPNGLVLSDAEDMLLNSLTRRLFPGLPLDLTGVDMYGVCVSLEGIGEK